MSFNMPWGRPEDTHHEEATDTPGEAHQAHEETAEEVVEETTEEVSEPKPKPRQRRSTGQLSKPQTKAVAEKTLVLVETQPEVLELAASVLGTKADVAEMVAELFAHRGAPPTLGDLTKMRAGDEFEATAIALEMKRPEIRRVWALARELGADIPKTVPNGTAASIQLARAVVSLEPSALARLAQVEDLIGS